MVQTARLSRELEQGIDILVGERSLTSLSTASVLGFLKKHKMKRKKKSAHYLGNAFPPQTEMMGRLGIKREGEWIHTLLRM